MHAEPRGPADIPWSYRFSLRFEKQSLQYTGRFPLGLKGTSHSFLHSAQIALCISRGPPKLSWYGIVSLLLIFSSILLLSLYAIFYSKMNFLLNLQRICFSL